MAPTSDFSPSLHALEEYFRAWRNLDPNAIQDLFSADATYEIRNRSILLSGNEKIVGYWQRNASRQQGLRITWNAAAIHPMHADAEFCAIFFDTEEMEQQRVEGILTIVLNAAFKIQLLTEVYRKLVM
jgi:hypothetical protein